jgi:hypothetical protein
VEKQEKHEKQEKREKPEGRARIGRAVSREISAKEEMAARTARTARIAKKVTTKMNNKKKILRPRGRSL